MDILYRTGFEKQSRRTGETSAYIYFKKVLSLRPVIILR
ncbi:Uncharacterized protein dnm_024080 [Desulfonema magnum]|uniref:Uncharacterized protein n=1 Tax=Desulfonema magnum TaxID=45655 RepID=A0A975GM71_9BACT|nr:Uncharacterized protein dnm_024080 [Desulfonema magnum]